MVKKNTFGDKVIEFNSSLTINTALPEGFAVLNPFREEGGAGTRLMSLFYKKFYNDHRDRKFLIGINPGRHGAGITGVPFTDTKRLSKLCGIPSDLKASHEVSATFIYDMIAAYGGVEAFYGDVYIHSLFPLALIRKNNKGTWVNCNYYDDRRLVTLLKPFIISQIKEQITFGVNTDTAYILGKKNAVLFEAINKEEELFKKYVILPHPRYIQQYQSKFKEQYIQMYIDALKSGDSVAAGNR